MFRSEAAKAALVKWRKHQHRKGNGEPSPVPGSPGHKRLWGAAAAQPPGPWWATRIVRLQRDPWAEGAVRQPLVFAGGVGEPPPRPCAPCASLAPIAEGGRGGGASASAEAPQPPLAEEAPPPLEKEHKFWSVLKFVSSSHKCILLPLIAAGRFGGCGRRAGRIRWRAAPEKQGYERESNASLLQLVSAESVTGAREPEGEAWAIDEHDVEQASREQAAAARNKRRRLIAEAQGEPYGLPFDLVDGLPKARRGGGGGGGAKASPTCSHQETARAGEQNVSSMHKREAHGTHLWHPRQSQLGRTLPGGGTLVGHLFAGDTRRRCL